MKKARKSTATCAAILLSLTLGLQAFAASGHTISPPANTDSSIGLKGESGETVASISYRTDSDPDKFYIGMTTTWSDSQFAAAFADQDAFFYGITVNPSVPASSLPTLAILNPYEDEDGNATVPTKSVKIYQELDGKLTDVTKNFSAVKNDDDRSVFVTKTRKPGFYIFAEQAIDVKLVTPAKDKSEKSSSKTEEKPTSKSSSSTNDTGVYLPKLSKK